MPAPNIPLRSKARRDKQEIAQAVDVAEHIGITGLHGMQRTHGPLGTPADGPGLVQKAAGQV